MFENLVEKLKANPRRIVYTEGSDARILESAARLKNIIKSGDFTENSGKIKIDSRLD